MTTVSVIKKTLALTLLAVTATVNCFAGNRDTYKTIAYQVEQPGASSEVSVDFPVDVKEPVRAAVLEYIYDALRAFKSDLMPEDPSMKYCTEATFKTVISDFAETLASWYGREQQEYAASLAEEGETYETEWYIHISINKAAETPQYVSYASYYGDYQGGAHGGRFSDGVTIRKSDGKRIKDIFRDGVESQMQPLLWKYLLAEMSSEEEKQEYRNEIMTYLGDQSKKDVPLASVSYLAPDGIHLEYQSYEIGPWSLGAPNIVIPVSEALPYLTKKAARLVNGKK